MTCNKPQCRKSMTARDRITYQAMRRQRRSKQNHEEETRQRIKATLDFLAMSKE